MLWLKYGGPPESAGGGGALELYLYKKKSYQVLGKNTLILKSVLDNSEKK